MPRRYGGHEGVSVVGRLEAALEKSTSFKANMAEFGSGAGGDDVEPGSEDVYLRSNVTQKIDSFRRKNNPSEKDKNGLFTSVKDLLEKIDRSGNTFIRLDEEIEYIIDKADLLGDTGQIPQKVLALFGL